MEFMIQSQLIIKEEIGMVSSYIINEYHLEMETVVRTRYHGHASYDAVLLFHMGEGT